MNRGEMMLFWVVHKETKEVVGVYQISEDTYGNPFFLVYMDNHWFHCDANLFEPYIEQPSKGDSKKKTLNESKNRKDEIIE